MHNKTEENKTERDEFFAKAGETFGDNILLEALSLTTGDRNHSYGPPEKNFEVTSDLWDTYLMAREGGRDTPIQPIDVATLMMLLKIARLAESPMKRDTLTDIAGYASCAKACQDADRDGELRLSNLPSIVRSFDGTAGATGYPVPSFMSDPPEGPVCAMPQEDIGHGAEVPPPAKHEMTPSRLPPKTEPDNVIPMPNQIPAIDHGDVMGIELPEGSAIIGMGGGPEGGFFLVDTPRGSVVKHGDCMDVEPVPGCPGPKYSNVVRVSVNKPSLI